MAGLPIIVLTNRTFPETRAALEGAARLSANDDTKPWSRHEVLDRCHQAIGIMAFMTDRIDRAFLDQCPNLKVVGAALKGFDNIDVEAATERGVWVTIVSDLLTVPTAELAIGLMLSLGRQMLPGDRNIRENGFHGWRPTHYGTGLDGARIGIVGFGRVGQAIAERLVGFRCHLSAYDSQPLKVPAHLAGKVALSDLPEVLGQSEFVVLALPLTAATQHIIDAAAIARMRRGALLVNPARGSLVDERAVADAIDLGHLGGYAADVFECEDWARPARPTVVDPRLLHPDSPTVLTPHIGSAVIDVRRKIEASAARSILDVLEGRIPVSAINAPHRC